MRPGPSVSCRNLLSTLARSGLYGLCRLLGLFGLCGFLLALAAQASPANPRVIGTWTNKSGLPVLDLSFQGALTYKQTYSLNSGFTTVSILSLWRSPSLSAGKDETSAVPLLTLRCAVKFDAWEEHYNITSLLAEGPRLQVHTGPLSQAQSPPAPEAHTVKQFSDFGEICLQIHLPGSSSLADLATTGKLMATLSIKQSSSAETGKIKEWLTDQQSGLIQSLFAHMLGELSDNDSVPLVIELVSPPKSPRQKLQ